MRKKVIVTAQDYGLCRSVNAGIEYVLSHKNNIITDIALLPNAPASDEAATYLRTNKISASLCLNLTSFRPLSNDVLSLTDKSGEFLKVDISTWDFSSLDRFNEEDIKKEVKAQWDWFTERVGTKPNAILSRKNETGDPKVLMPVVDIAKREGVPTRSPFWKWRSNYGAQSYVDQMGVKATDDVFIGLKNWGGKYGYDLQDDLEKLVDDINKSRGISEIIVFPGFVDQELFNISSINWQRGQFIQLIEKGEVARQLKSFFELVGYRDMVLPKPKKKTNVLLQEISFRPGNQKDIPSIIKVIENDGFSHAYPLSVDRLSNLFSRKEFFVIAKHNTKVIGFGSVDCEIRARIHFLSVDTSYSGIGVGSTIMKRMLDIVKEKGYKKAHTIVEHKSSKEIFLKKFGFHEVGYYKDRYGLGKDATIWEIIIE